MEELHGIGPYFIVLFDHITSMWSNILLTRLLQFITHAHARAKEHAVHFAPIFSLFSASSSTCDVIKCILVLDLDIGTLYM